MGNVPQHHGDLARGVEEIAAARADDHEDGDLEPSHAFLDHAGARRGAAFHQVVAELDTISPARLGGKRRVHGVDTGFDEDVRR